jgi:hypothetical protein
MTHYHHPISFILPASTSPLPLIFAVTLVSITKKLDLKPRLQAEREVEMTLNLKISESS